MQNKINRRTLFKLSGLLPVLAAMPMSAAGAPVQALEPVDVLQQKAEIVEPLPSSPYFLFTNGFKVTWLDDEVVVSPGDVMVIRKSDTRQFFHQNATTSRLPLMATWVGEVHVRLVANWSAQIIRVEVGPAQVLSTLARDNKELLTVLGTKYLSFTRLAI